MVVEAGLVTLLRTVLIIALVYYALKIIVRFLFPYLIKKFINKQQSNFSNQQESNHSSSNSSSSEAKANKKPKEKLGDYVDYEEIKD